VDDVQSYVNLKMAQQISGAGQVITSARIHVKLNDIEDAVPMSKMIENLYDVKALDINTANAQFDTGSDIRTLISYAVSITLLIVAGFGIFNILNMFIYEKMNDIAILKAIGFTGRDVMFIFITQALMIGIIGGGMGLLLGYGVSVVIDNVPYVTEALPTVKTFPVKYDPFFYYTGIAFALVFTFPGRVPACPKSTKNRSGRNYQRAITETMQRLILETKNIDKYFLYPVKFHVLKDISIQLARGEFVSIIGKSGCGKSTLLYILSTMDTSYEGELFIDGQKMSDLSRNELARIRNEKIGFIFQFHYLLPEFTVLKNVMLPALKLGKESESAIKKKAYEKLERLGIAEQAHQKAFRISGGQKQRVAIARALINNPKIIMGDEPTGNLDSKNSENVFNTLRQLSHEQELSMLIVTHDMDFAQKTDRIIEMGDGVVL
jgi:lipoprotein-releasing system ATP-binding protein